MLTRKPAICLRRRISRNRKVEELLNTTIKEQAYTDRSTANKNRRSGYGGKQITISAFLMGRVEIDNSRGLSYFTDSCLDFKAGMIKSRSRI